MIKSILSQLPHTRLTLSAKTTLLHEGSISTKIYLIESGCIRLWFNNDGKDVTLQFFMQGQVVSSFESFINNQPSRFTLETVL
ncbi:MAG: cyclic nucleotide-binding domain-containing protein, partial [Alistipes sp.]|nr:cyclic nucleotide-binding domain-containing protein [Alistipes sp.]